MLNGAHHIDGIFTTLLDQEVDLVQANTMLTRARTLYQRDHWGR
jgi:hypothetical protein